MQRNSTMAAVAAVAFLLLAVGTGSARGARRSTPQPPEALVTWFLDATSPQFTVLEAPQPGVTRVQLRLHAGAVPARMPVVVASAETGMVHTVVNTFDWLKRHADAHARLQKNMQRRPAAAYRFPLPGLVLTSASAMVRPEQADPDVEATITREINTWQMWKHAAAPSALLMLPSQAVAAVADFVETSLDAGSASEPVAVLTLDIVHTPYTFNEFLSHGLQSSDHTADGSTPEQGQEDTRPHYHFYVPAGVSIDAAAFHDKLKQAAYTPQALSIFFKGLPQAQWERGVDGGDATATA